MTTAAASVTATAAAASSGTQRAAGTVSQSCPRVTLEIGVFFDGTGNNAANVEGGSSWISDSYNASLSNVVLLHRLYLNEQATWPRNSCGYAIKRARIYMEGIGTTAGQSDWRPNNRAGAAVGMGPTGVESRVYEACLQVGREITRLSPGVEPEEVVMDVFGFSRGSAAARYFVNCFRQGYIQYNRNRAHLPAGRKIRFRFIGVFDTVAAIGVGTNADNGPVNVHMKAAQANAIMHLTAANEYRENFRLNHNLRGGGGHREMPGAHSDVGGGYAGTGDESLVEQANTRSFSSRTAAETARAADARAATAARTARESFYVREGWIDPGDPRGGLVNEPGPIRSRPAGGLMGMGGTIYSYTTAARLVRPWVAVGLSRIPLAIMHKAAVDASVPFATLPTGGNYAIPGPLQSLSATLRAGGTPSADMRRRALRDYGHMSSNFSGIGMDPEPRFVRSIDWNQPGLAK